MNDSSYPACSLACAPVRHTIERVPGIQSRIWAAWQHCRPEIETPHRTAGHLDVRDRRSHKHPPNDCPERLLPSYFLLYNSLSLPIIRQCSNDKARLRLFSKQQACIACVSRCFDLATLILKKKIKTHLRKKERKNLRNNAEENGVIPSKLSKKHFREELGNHSALKKTAQGPD